MEMYAKTKQQKLSICTHANFKWQLIKKKKKGSILSILSFTSPVTQLLSYNRLQAPKRNLTCLSVIKQD